MHGLEEEESARTKNEAFDGLRTASEGDDVMADNGVEELKWSEEIVRDGRHGQARRRS